MNGRVFEVEPGILGFHADTLGFGALLVETAHPETWEIHPIMNFGPAKMLLAADGDFSPDQIVRIENSPKMIAGRRINFGLPERPTGSSNVSQNSNNIVWHSVCVARRIGEGIWSDALRLTNDNDTGLRAGPLTLNHTAVNGPHIASIKLHVHIESGGRLADFDLLQNGNSLLTRQRFGDGPQDRVIPIRANVNEPFDFRLNSTVQVATLIMRFQLMELG